MKLNQDNIQLGSSMVLYRADEHKKLELHRNIKVRLSETHSELDRLIKIDINIYNNNEKEKEDYFIQLAMTVRSADEFRLTSKNAEKARSLLNKYVEERMDPKTKKMLDDAIVSKNKQLLIQVLQICEDNGYQTSKVCKIRVYILYIYRL